MMLEQRIAAIIAQDCLSPAERAAVILAQPDIAQGLALSRAEWATRTRREIGERLARARRLSDIAFGEADHAQPSA